VLNRTFGCVRVVWNRTLAWRQQRYQADKTGTTYAQASAYLTALKTTEELTWLNEVSCVPLQQAIRHQQAAYAAFFAKRARYPRFKSRQGRQSAAYTRSGFRWRDGALYLAKMGMPLTFTWSWPDIDPATIDPTTVTVSRDPCGRWYVAFAVDVSDPGPLPATGRAVGMDKAARYGRRVIVIDRWFPSSKMCSTCGHVLAALSLDTRHWTCPSCGTRHDRDVNAAKNILAAGLAVAGGDSGHACGADVSHPGSPGCSRAVKQELRPARIGIPIPQDGG
jgi:transposase